MKRKIHWTSALKYIGNRFKVKLIITKKEILKKPASLEEVYREENNSDYPYERGFNGLREGDY